MRITAQPQAPFLRLNTNEGFKQWKPLETMAMKENGKGV